jgi:hypothetical protein
MSMTKARFALALFLTGMLAIHAGAWWRLRRPIALGYPDFTIFYSAGKMVRSGMAHQLYDETVEWQVQQQVAPQVAVRSAPLPYMHAPFEALLFVPFSYFSYPTAYLLWNAVSLAMLIGVCALLRTFCPALQPYRTLWAFSFLAYFPAFLSMLEGQDTILLLLIYVLVFVSLKKGSPFVAGCLLAVALFRVHLVIPFLLLMLLLSKWRLAAGFFMTAAGLAGISAALVGFRALLQYPGYIWSLEHQRGRAIFPPRLSVSLRGLAEGVLPSWFSSYAVLFMVLIVSMVALFLLAWKWHGRRESEVLDLLFSLALIFVLLVGYHTMLYDLTLLLLPISLVVNRAFADRPREGAQRAALFVPIALFFFTPVYMILWTRNWEQSNLMAFMLLAWAVAIWREIVRAESISRAENIPVRAAV